MNTEKFLALYKATLENFHSKQKAPATDMALISLLELNKDIIIQQNYLENDPDAFEFHKGFRNQAIPCGQTATAIWFLLQDAPIFRMVLKEQKVLSPDENKIREDYLAKG
jgi:hypothetical protein